MYVSFTEHTWFSQQSPSLWTARVFVETGKSLQPVCQIGRYVHLADLAYKIGPARRLPSYAYHSRVIQSVRLGLCLFTLILWLGRLNVVSIKLKLCTGSIQYHFCDNHISANWYAGHLIIATIIIHVVA